MDSNITKTEDVCNPLLKEIEEGYKQLGVSDLDSLKASVASCHDQKHLEALGLVLRYIDSFDI